MKPNPLQILKSAKNILLVDWPDPGVPRALLKAGFTVFGFSPNGYSKARLVPDAIDGQSNFPPRNPDEKDYLVFEKLANRPDAVDIVNVYRPEGEHAGIIEKHVLPLHAKVLWLHPPLTSVSTAAIANENRLIFIEGANIAETAAKLN
jgi:predicted CoA-binding protein